MHAPELDDLFSPSSRADDLFFYYPSTMAHLFGLYIK